MCSSRPTARVMRPLSSADAASGTWSCDSGCRSPSRSSQARESPTCASVQPCPRSTSAVSVHNAVPESRAQRRRRLCSASHAFCARIRRSSVTVVSQCLGAQKKSSTMLITVVCAAIKPPPPPDTPSASAATQPFADASSIGLCSATKSSFVSRGPRSLANPASMSKLIGLGSSRRFAVHGAQRMHEFGFARLARGALRLRGAARGGPALPLQLTGHDGAPNRTSAAMMRLAHAAQPLMLFACRNRFSGSSCRLMRSRRSRFVRP